MKSHAPQHQPFPCDPLQACANGAANTCKPAATLHKPRRALKWLDNQVLREFAMRETGN